MLPAETFVERVRRPVEPTLGSGAANLPKNLVPAFAGVGGACPPSGTINRETFDSASSRSQFALALAGETGSHKDSAPKAQPPRKRSGTQDRDGIETLESTAP